jgi:SPP1 gp7 family putative phage head morphogenesis protein
MPDPNDQRAVAISPSLVQRVAQGVKYIVSGITPTTWFGPSQPLKPFAPPETKGRQFDYPVGFNLRISPRSEEGITFPQMRALADNYDLLRLVIETRKDQIAKFAWTIKAKESKTVADARLRELTDFFRCPDQEHGWDEWLRALLEDMLVVDAATIYPRRTRGGELYALELMDGATIKRLLNADGRTPRPPDPAYQQVLHGLPSSDYTLDELLYRPRNVRTARVYGFSPVEQIIMTINIALRRQLHQLQFYTEGNVPEMLFGVPETWNMDQIEQFQRFWDSVLEGDTAARRHGKFVPGGIKPLLTKEGALKDEMDDWLARVVCYAFSVSPTPFIKQVNRATAETAHVAALQEGLMPIQSWIKNTMDFALANYLREPDAEFVWQPEEEINQLEEAQKHKIYVEAKVITVDEVREELGLDPMTEEQKAELTAAQPQERVLPPGSPGVLPTAADGVGPRAQGARPASPAEKAPASPAGKAASPAILAKAARRLAPIPFDRPLVNKERAKLAKAFGAVLKKQGAALARAALAKIAKVGSGGASSGPPPVRKDATDDEIERLLRELDPDAWTVLIDPSEEALRNVMQDTGQTALKQLGLQDNEAIVRVVSERAVSFAKERAAELVSQISDSTKDMLRGLISRALEEGPDPKALAKDIRDALAFSPARAEMIARTELGQAHSQGALEGYKAAADTGIAMKKEWAAGGGDTCDICETNEAEGPIALDDEFPSGDDAPLAHPNCECALVPVVTDERYAITTDEET